VLEQVTLHDPCVRKAGNQRGSAPDLNNVLLLAANNHCKKNLLDMVASSLKPGECSGTGTVQKGSRAKTLFNNLQRLF